MGSLPRKGRQKGKVTALKEGGERKRVRFWGVGEGRFVPWMRNNFQELWDARTGNQKVYGWRIGVCRFGDPFSGGRGAQNSGAEGREPVPEKKTGGRRG